MTETTTSTPAPATEPASHLVTPAWRATAGRMPAAQIVVLLVVFVVAASTIDGFLGKSSIYSVLVLASFLGIAAGGQTLVILLGAIDLSVSYVISAVELVGPVLMLRGWPTSTVIVVMLIAGAVVGIVNGFVVKRFRASPLIVTLATGAVVYGLALANTRSGQAPGAVASWMSTFSSPTGRTFGIGIPPVVILWAILAIGLGVLLARSVTGRRLYATGANERAAELAGVRTVRTWLFAYGLSGAMAAVTGILLSGFVGGPSAGVGDSYLWTSLAAVFVGGTSLVGARGDYWRTVLGALILTLITTVLIAHGAGQAVQEAAYGALILVFVGFYGREGRIRDRV